MPLTLGVQPANITLGWKGLPWTDAQTYLASSQVKRKNVFEQDPWPNLGPYSLH